MSVRVVYGVAQYPEGWRVTVDIGKEERVSKEVFSTIEEADAHCLYIRNHMRNEVKPIATTDEVFDWSKA